MKALHPRALASALRAVVAERRRQDTTFGEQNHPDGTGGPDEQELVIAARAAYEDAKAHGQLTWLNVLLEEVAEALAESDPARLREELVQVAAVATAWVEAIDRRSGR